MILTVALFLLSSRFTDDLPPAGRFFVLVWIGTAVCIGVSVLMRGVTRIDVDGAGVCTFRAPLRVVATCALAAVSDVRLPVHGRTLRLRASGRKVAVVLPMNGIATFVSRVKAARRPDELTVPAPAEPVVCRTHARVLRFQALAWGAFVVVASYVLWSWSDNDRWAAFRLFELLWVGFVIWIFWTTFMRKVIRIEVDQAGSCTFRAQTRVVATCGLADVSDVRLLGDGRTLRVQASGRKVSVLLPMDGIETFVASVRAANPGVGVSGL